MGNLLAAIDRVGRADQATEDEDEFSSGMARNCEHQGANLRQALAYAVSTGKLSAVIDLAHDCEVRLEGDAAPLRAQEVLRQASAGEWAAAAYHAAVAADAPGDEMADLLAAKDAEVCQRMRNAAGEVRVQLPRDLRLAFARTSKLPSVVRVEQPRWLLPRPRGEQQFLAVDGKKLEDGWYEVVRYPVGDDLKQAVFRRKYWEGALREEAAYIARREGETLLCKAVKAGQWAFAEWLVQRGRTAELALQLQDEFVGLWDSVERSAYLHKHEDLATLCACLDNDAVLARPWRHGPLLVPSGARVMFPRLETLRDALSLGSLSMQALQLVGAARVVLAGAPGPAARRAWRADLAALGEDGLGRPLLHCAVAAGRLEFAEQLVQAMVDLESRDAAGQTALAIAASHRHWEALDLLLREGCRVDGASGALAMAAMQRLARPGPSRSGEEAERAAEMLRRLVERHQRAPAARLEDYFERLAAGEIVHGTQPRRYEVKDGVLRLRGGGLEVSARVLILDKSASAFDVCFAPLAPGAFASVVSAGVADVSRCDLCSEQQLIDRNVPLAAPVAVPRGQLAASGPDKSFSVKRPGAGPLAAQLPLIARAPPPGGLRAESVTSCCRESIGGVDLVVDGIRVGETNSPAPPSTVSEEVRLAVPPRELDVVAELCGRRLHAERIVGGPDAEMVVEVSIGIFFYKLLFPESGDENVCACGHRRDIPEEATPYIGQVTWDQGSERLVGYKPVLMGPSDCLARLQSMRLAPDLPPGRAFEAEEWVDTSCDGVKACQFQRCFFVPVKVGKIFNA